MSYKFNPFTGALDDVGAGDAATTPGGSDGQIQFNDSGSFGGVTGSSVDATGSITLSLAGAASTPPVSFTGSWFTGGTGTTTKPQLLIEPTGTTSTAWSTSGTGLGVNAASGFSGNLLDLQTNGTSRMVVQGDGKLGLGPSSPGANIHLASTSSPTIYIQSENAAAGSFGELRLGNGSGGTSALSSVKSYRVNAGTAETALSFETTNSSNTKIEALRVDSSQRVGIGATTPGDKLEIGGAGAGIILASPNGTRYRLTVANGGTLSIAAV